MENRKTLLEQIEKVVAESTTTHKIFQNRA